ncbi:hypothetical protein [Actinokineospora cianjurensis]|uniref:DNA-binding protein n=1 Tax=Actinokineospora cianjurensis TaxID=585224 RepID=A0A421AX10_9PSEU|nr:hypothetical protein [Actinokineospora cianjurensis]RLK54372.1 hypothetical protein CLV68_5922 [Actinokineospora cianjurensis]
MGTEAALVAAGAVLPGVSAGGDRDTLVARHYEHPAVEDRVVVRLVPEVLGVAEDLTAEYLGFAAPVSAVPVGVARRSALGFPAWALINDPGTARHALALVKDIERLDRVAKSKAGAAKDGFGELATMLGRSAPHFLPTFYEEAARIFLRHGNGTYAATMFGKAREAEQVHDLAVDGERVRAVFLEFAFAGVLPAKALTAHARDLARRFPPAEAYERFRTLCVERVRGGLPPHAGMPEDLRRLAKAARLDLRAEDKWVLREILGTASISRAATGFWKSYRDSLVALATEEPGIRARLLAFVPRQRGTTDTWLDILTAGGATEALTGPPDPTVPTTPAGWLGEIVAARWSDWQAPARSQALLTLVAAMVARLVADAEPVAVVARRDDVELDLLDLLLANDVPLRLGTEPLDMGLRQWIADDGPGRRDLTAVAGGELGPRLGSQAVDYLRQSNRGKVADIEQVRAVMAVPGLRAALRDLLTTRAAAPRKTVQGLADAVQEFAVLGTPYAFTDVPEAADTLAATDVVGALRHTLAAGLLDELGWPALDDAAEAYLTQTKHHVEVVGEGWPALVLGKQDHFVAVGPDGVLVEHTARIPADARSQWSYSATAHWFDGGLLVNWRGPDGILAYWADNPAKQFEPGELNVWNRVGANASIALPGGGRFTGKRAVHPGDTRLPEPRAAFGDGSTVWSARYGNAWEWFQVDPATGATGRVGRPAFLDDFAADGARLELLKCDLRPTAPGTESSPLGAAGGLHGWRLRQEADGTWTGEGIDGRRINSSHQVSALLDLPGSRVAVVREYGAQRLLDPDGEILARVSDGAHHPDYAAGTPLVVPLHWWHVLRPRDEAGSAALRAVSRGAVEKMLKAAVAEREGDGESVVRAVFAALRAGKQDRVVKAVLAGLPGLSHPALVAGVVGVVRMAAEHLVRLRAFNDIAKAAREQGDWLAGTGPVVTEDEVSAALNHFGRYESGRPTGAATTMPAALAALRAAAGRSAPDAGPLPGPLAADWVDALPHIGLLVQRAASPVTPETERATLAQVLRWTADSGVLDQPGRWRRAMVTLPEKVSIDRHHVIPVRDGFIVVVDGGWYGREATALQYTGKPGQFDLPRDWSLAHGEDLPTALGREWIEEFLLLLDRDGAAPWRPEAVAALVEETGMGSAEAAYLLAGLPGVDMWASTFISTENRALLGLSLPGAKAAKQRMKNLDPYLRRRLLATTTPSLPGALWDTGPDVAAVARVWVDAVGRSRPVPDDVLVEAARLPLRGPADRVVAVLNPGTSVLVRDAEMRLDGDKVVSRHADGFHGADLHDVPPVLLWLAQRLPASSPHRATLAESLALVRQRVAHPDFAVPLGNVVDESAVRALLGVELPEPSHTVRVRDWLTLTSAARWSYLMLWPGRLGQHDRDLLVAVAEMTESQHVVAALDLIAADGVVAACAVPSAGDADSYYQDPTFSVPHLVKEVVEQHGLDEDAASLYLQLLALPDPTDANVARWTGWKPARLRKARAALAETDLVVTAKRTRAGRSLFLPGGWLALAAPHLPLETWKTAMFGFTDAPRGVIAAREPLADLFARAWSRATSGDAPGYEELRTGRRR